MCTPAVVNTRVAPFTNMDNTGRELRSGVKCVVVTIRDGIVEAKLI